MKPIVACIPVLFCVVCFATAGCAAKATTCNGVDQQVDTNSCSYGFHACDDGHTYAIACMGTTCSCQIDGKAQKNVTLTTCPSPSSTLDGLKTVNTTCGWSLQPPGGAV